MEVGNDTFEYILNPRSETTNFASHLSLPKFLKVCYHSPNSSNLKLKLRGLSTMNSIRWRWDSNSDPTRKPVCLCQYAAFPREEVKGSQGKCRGCQARKKSSCGTLLQRTSLSVIFPYLEAVTADDYVYKLGMWHCLWPGLQGIYFPMGL